MSLRIDIDGLQNHTVEITFCDATGTRRRLVLEPERECGRVDLRRSDARRPFLRDRHPHEAMPHVDISAMRTPHYKNGDISVHHSV